MHKSFLAYSLIKQASSLNDFFLPHNYLTNHLKWLVSLAFWKELQFFRGFWKLNLLALSLVYLFDKVIFLRNTPVAKQEEQDKNKLYSQSSLIANTSSSPFTLISSTNPLRTCMSRAWSMWFHTCVDVETLHYHPSTHECSL